MLKLNRGDQAKQCFMEALALDVKCYESFEQLMSGEMMTPDEGGLRKWRLPHFIHLFISLRLTIEFRMGVYSRTSVLLSDATRCSIRSINLHRPSPEIQTRNGAFPNTTETGRRIRPWRQPRCTIQLCRLTIRQLPVCRLLHYNFKVRTRSCCIASLN
jgi:hypothetical protein